MDDPAAPERGEDRERKTKRRPKGSQRLDAAPNAGASVAKPQGSEQAQSAGRDRGRPKLDDDAQPVALAFDVEAQGPPRLRLMGRHDGSASSDERRRRKPHRQQQPIPKPAGLCGALV